MGVPLPVIPAHAPPAHDRATIAEDLSRAVRGQVRFGVHDRQLYSTDASLYQTEPIGVVVPLDVDDVRATLAYCHAHAIPVLPRGGGTSLAGQCTNAAVVIDLSASCRRVLRFDPDARTVDVEAGITIGELNRFLESRQCGLFYAPDPATVAQATIGGCIGNNAAGARSLVYGRTSENVLAVDVLLVDGRRTTLRAGAGRTCDVARELAQGVARVVRARASDIRERFPKTIRRNAGYGLDLGAARNNAECRAYVPLLPLVDGRDPAAVLYVEYQGDETDAVVAKFDELRRVVPDAPAARYLDKPSLNMAWALRRAGEPLLHGLSGKRKPITFVEDNAVPVETLPRFVAAFKEIVTRHGTVAAYWAHASVGVLHVRPMLDLHDPADRERMRKIAVEVADLARACGGVMSGEHGDGKARGPLLERFFGSRLVAAFGEVKRVFDVKGILNPGDIVGAADVPGRPGDVQRRRRLPQDSGRVNVPQLPRHARRAPQHSRARERAADERRRRHRPVRLRRPARLGRPRHDRHARPLPVVQGVQDRVSQQRRRVATEGGVYRPTVQGGRPRAGVGARVWTRTRVEPNRVDCTRAVQLGEFTKSNEVVVQPGGRVCATTLGADVRAVVIEVVSRATFILGATIAPAAVFCPTGGRWEGRRGRS